MRGWVEAREVVESSQLNEARCYDSKAVKQELILEIIERGCELAWC